MAVIKLGQLLHRATTAPIDESNPLNVALSGTKVVLRLVEGLAIADTEVRTYPVDVKGISDIMITAYSNLDQPVTVTVLRTTGVPIQLWDTNTNTFKNAGSIIVPAHAGFVIVTSHPAAEFVKRFSGEMLTLSIKCNTAPTYGSFSLSVTGVRV